MPQARPPGSRVNSGPRHHTFNELPGGFWHLEPSDPTSKTLPGSLPENQTTALGEAPISLRLSPWISLLSNYPSLDISSNLVTEPNPSSAEIQTASSTIREETNTGHSSAEPAYEITAPPTKMNPEVLPGRSIRLTEWCGQTVFSLGDHSPFSENRCCGGLVTVVKDHPMSHDSVYLSRPIFQAPLLTVSLWAVLNYSISLLSGTWQDDIRTFLSPLKLDVTMWLVLVNEMWAETTCVTPGQKV